MNGRHEAPTALRLLVVCTANVCRSPLAEAVFVAHCGADIEVRSAGLRAYPGHLPCRLAGDLLSDDPAAAQVIADHRAQALTMADLHWADLVLTAERAQRAEIVHRAPALRNRTFTLVQASRLIGIAGRSLLADPAAPARPPRSSDLIAAMDHLRAHVPAEARGARGRRNRLRRRPAEVPDDISDGHLGTQVAHLDTARDVRTAALAICQGFAQVADASPPGPS